MDVNMKVNIKSNTTICTARPVYNPAHLSAPFILPRLQNSTEKYHTKKYLRIRGRTYLKFGERNNIAVVWSMPNCLLRNGIIIIKPRSILIEQFPPLIVIGFLNRYSRGWIPYALSRCQIRIHLLFCTWFYYLHPLHLKINNKKTFIKSEPNGILILYSSYSLVQRWLDDFPPPRSWPCISKRNV